MNEPAFEPERRAPEGISVQWVVDAIDAETGQRWPWHTRIEDDLFSREFYDRDDEKVGKAVANMFNDFRKAIDKAMATTAGDDPTIRFKFWRKLSDKATKMKPAHLKGTLYLHPDYGNVWLFIEYQ